MEDICMKDICMTNNMECSRCTHGKKSIFKVFKFAKGKSAIDFWIEETTIVFLLEGEIQLSYNGNSKKTLDNGGFILLPPACNIHFEVLEDSDIVTCKLGACTHFCETFSMASLTSYNKGVEVDSYFPLPINKRLNEFLFLLKSYASDELKCNRLHETKVKEMLYLFRMYYDKRELGCFFFPILGRDMSFREQVLKNYHKAHNVGELAGLMNYSVSGFEKRFKKCFAQPAYGWMQKKKAELILRELRENNKSIKEIASVYGFSSLARLYEFCKSHHGETPGRIRQHSES